MKTLIVSAISTLALFGAAHAQTQEPRLYGELGYTNLKLSEEGFSGTAGLLRGIVGYTVHPNFAVEGMLGFGVKDAKDRIDSGVPMDVTMKAKQAFGVFLKPKAQVTDDLEVFGRVGYVNTKIDLAVTDATGSFSGSDSDSDVAYGFGASYRVAPQAYVTLDYMNYYKKDGFKADGFTLGVGYRF